MIEITNDNRKDLIASCLIEAANVLKDNTEVLEEAAIQTNISKLKYKIWVDPAGASRNKADTEPRVKIEVNRKLIPIYIPKSRGEKPYILVKNIEAQQKSKTGKIKGLDDVYDFILKYKLWWLLSFGSWADSKSYVFFINASNVPGRLDYYNYDVYSFLEVRPVISISKCAKVKSGIGTPESPYEIDENSCSK